MISAATQGWRSTRVATAPELRDAVAGGPLDTAVMTHGNLIGDFSQNIDLTSLIGLFQLRLSVTWRNTDKMILEDGTVDSLTPQSLS